MKLYTTISDGVSSYARERMQLIGALITDFDQTSVIERATPTGDAVALPATVADLAAIDFSALGSTTHYVFDGNWPSDFPGVLSIGATGHSDGALVSIRIPANKTSGAVNDATIAPVNLLDEFLFDSDTVIVIRSLGGVYEFQAYGEGFPMKRVGRFVTEAWTNNTTDFWRTFGGWSSGSAPVTLGLTGHPGAAEFTTASSSSGASGAQIQGPGNMLLSSGMRLEFEFKTPAAFSATANLFGHMGFGGNATTANSFVRGAYARYEGNGQLKAYVSNVDTGNTGTAIATLATSTWYQIAIELTATGAIFQLFSGSDGSLIASQTVTGTWPTATTSTAPGISAGRSATDAALTSYVCLTVDYAAFVLPNLGRRIFIGG